MKIDNSFFAASRLGMKPLPPPAEETDKKDITGGFKSLLDDLMDASKAASAESRMETAKLLTGTVDDFPAFQVTGEKSNLLFEMNLTVRTKVIEAYTEILKTQI